LLVLLLLPKNYFAAQTLWETMNLPVLSNEEPAQANGLFM